MKAKRNLAMIMVAFAAAMALTLAPAPALADTGDDVGSFDVSAADAGGAGVEDVGASGGGAAPDMVKPDNEAGDELAGGADDEAGGAEAGGGEPEDGAGAAVGDGEEADGESDDGDGDEVGADGESGDGDESGDGAGADGDGDEVDGDEAGADGQSGDVGDGEEADGESDDESDEETDGESDEEADDEEADGKSGEGGDGAGIAVAFAGAAGSTNDTSGMNAANTDSGVSATATATSGNNPGTTGNVKAAGASASSSAASGLGGELNIALLLVEGAISGSASGPVSWASGKILTSIFGSNMTGDADKKLDEILKALDEIRDAIASLKKTVDAQELDQLLNSMKNLIDAKKTDVIMANLKSLDEAKYSPDEYKERMKSALTEGMANGTLTDLGSIASPFNIFDTYVSDLWTAMTTTYDVTINNQSQKLTLMQVYYEHLRLKYKWEHQAYEEWEAYNDRCVSLLAASLGLERASLKARLEMLREYNATHTDKHDEGAVITLLNTTQDAINQMQGFVGEVKDESRDPENPTVKKVNYPGLFNKQAWEEQYWMYKERPDYRYYWVPGHECLFYAQVNTQDIPAENTSGSLLNPAVLQGIFAYPDGGTYDVEINYDHWKPFLNYQGGDSPLASETQLKTMYKDYGSSTHLYTIFMDKDNGNFFGLDEGDITHWWFVLGQTDAHHITLKQRDGNNFELYTYVVSSPHATQDTIDLARYGEYLTWWNSNRHYIGVGVVRYGPETYKPKNGRSEDDGGLAKAEIHTEVQYNAGIWWPSRGDLALGYDCDAHTAVDGVYMDGVRLGAACYAVEGGEVVLKQSYLDSLDYGEHELFVDTAEGGHTVVFGTQADGVYYVESGEGSGWTKGSGDSLVFVFKRTLDDAQTFQRLMDVLVDGNAVPLWGYAAHAGSAVVALTPDYLATLAPGAHTLTALFYDGNGPQAAFTVRGDKAKPAPTPVGYEAESAAAGQTPATGDGAGAIVMLVVAMALVAGCVAAYAWRRTRID